MFISPSTKTFLPVLAALRIWLDSWTNSDLSRSADGLARRYTPPMSRLWLSNSIQTVWTVPPSLRSGLGLQAEDSSFDTIRITPTSLPQGPVTQGGGQKALKPSILVVSAKEWVVSVSVSTATEARCLDKSIRIWSNLPEHSIPRIFTERTFRIAFGLFTLKSSVSQLPWLELIFRPFWGSPSLNFQPWAGVSTRGLTRFPKNSVGGQYFFRQSMMESGQDLT